MIHDLREIPVRNGDGAFGIIEDLAKLPYEFYLAGSRYMLCATKESDWDFYAKYEPEMVDRLLDAGFEQLQPSDSEYEGMDEGDPSSRYTHFVMAQGNVHIQILRDVELMRKVRDHIMENRLQEHIDTAKGSARREIWNETIVTIEREMLNAGQTPLPAPGWDAEILEVSEL